MPINIKVNSKIAIFFFLLKKQLNLHDILK